MPSTWRKQALGGRGRVNFFGFDPFDDDAMAIGQAAVSQSFAQTFVGVFELNVLPYHADAHFALRMLEGFEHGEPAAEVARRSLQMQQAENLFVEAFGGERHGDFVNIFHVGSGDDAGFGHVAEKRDFRFQIGGKLAIAAANQNVGLNTDAEKFFHAVLRGLGFQFAGCRNERDER